MGAILKRELGSYFNSAIAYIVLAVFYLLSGLLLSIMCICSNSANLSSVIGNMFMIILFLIPLITMKSFSEEKKQRTDQALLTSPTNLLGVVMGKFLGAFILFAFCVAIFLVYALVIGFYTTPDWSVILCTIFGLLLLGGALIAIDIFISALTESQVIAAVVSIAAGLLIYLLDSIASTVSLQVVDNIVSAISFNQNYNNFTYGILDLQNTVFFLSVIVIFNFLTIRVFEKRRWG